MTEYKVNLPKTDFPMRADLAKREPKILEFWQQINLYHNYYLKDRCKGTFVLHDGPPYANGNIHLGHTVNKISKDIIIKAKLMEGFTTPYVPGWDCHGLPVEINVEKKYGRPGEKISVEEFIDQSRKYAAEQIDLQRKSFIRLGIMADWEHPYRTMEFSFEADVIRSLAKVIANGYLERGFKPVHWCIACGSALAEAEVEYQDKESPAIYVRFRCFEPNLFNVANVSIPIWTTTPWTLPANEAVCVHPEYTYVLIATGNDNEHLVIAEKLLAEVATRLNLKNYKILKSYIGRDLEHLQLQHPFLAEKKVPVILGEHVTLDAGTGAVHTAPAHGQDDFRVGQKYHLPVNNPVGTDGKFLPQVEFFANENVFRANEHVLQVLQEKNNLLHAEKIIHSYPHCWRHKTPLIFRATPQWFVSMDKTTTWQGTSLREQSLAAIKTVQWFPQAGQERLHEMIKQRPDWCISRQRTWGTPMALFVHKTTGELHPEMPRLMQIIADNIEKVGTLFWRKLNAEEFLSLHAKNQDASIYEKVNDTLDVWFDSGVTHNCVLKQTAIWPKLHFPAELYLEGSDQYRGWYQSSLLTSVMLNGEAPYQQVFTHGFVVDANGHKMSKSLGNVIDPLQVTKTLGADILRLWTASAYLHDDLTVSDEILQRTTDAYRMLRNTARFLLGNLYGFNSATDLVTPDKLLALDKWALDQMLQLQTVFQSSYRNYEFHVACAQLQAVLSDSLSSLYFSIIKDRLYTMPEKSFARRSAQTALLHILEILVRIIAPIISFTAEEIWQEMRKSFPERNESVFMHSWYQVQGIEQVENAISHSNWREILAVKSSVNKHLEKLRGNGVIGSSLEADIMLFCDEHHYQLLQKLGNELRFVLLTSNATVKPLSAEPANALATEIAGVKVYARKTSQKKCCRCWHYLADVGQNSEHPELCSRCVDNLFGSGEKRFFA